MTATRRPAVTRPALARLAPFACLAVLAVVAAAVGVAPGQVPGRDPARGADGPATAGVTSVPPTATLPPTVPAPDPAAPRAGTVRFETVDVFVDPGDRPLAAYQVTVRAKADAALLVGLEGGEHPAFAATPYYDPKALIDERVVIAALTTGGDVPHGRTRVARLHVQVAGPAEPTFEATVQAAAGPDGTPLKAIATAAARATKG